MAEEEPKALNYIPEVILKKRKHSEAWALRKKEQLQKKDFQLRKSKDNIKKPEDFILEYRNREVDLIRMKRRVKRKRGEKSTPCNKPIIVIRIQGKQDMHPTTRKHLFSLGLRRIFSAVFVKPTDGVMAKLARAEPYVTYGLKLMPFSVMSPWVRGFEKEISGFLFTWFLMDTFVTFIFSVDFWVALEDFRRGSKEIVKEGCYLLSSMLNQAIQIKCLEAVLCGWFMRWILARLCGRVVAKMFQSTMEVYFMVTWLVFYFVAKSRDANQQGRRFGQREIEGLIDGHR